MKSLSDDAPFVLSLGPAGKNLNGNVSLSARPPCCTVADIHAIQQFEILSSTGPMEVRFEFENKGLIASKLFALGEGCQLGLARFIPDFVDKFAPMSADTPVPWFTESQASSNNGGPEIALDTFADEPQANCRNESIEVTSVTIRIAKANGMDFQEQFLTFLPPGAHFKCPGAGGETGPTTEELQRMWIEGNTSWKMTGLWESGMTELADELRIWARNPHQSFPLRFSNEELDSHGLKTVVEIYYEPKVDRKSYFEKPVFIRLRPPSPLEQKKVELTYWQSQQDSRRAELTKEIIVEMEKELRSTEVLIAKELP